MLFRFADRSSSVASFQVAGKTFPLPPQLHCDQCCADYDALLANRPYKPAWPEDRVIAELTRLRNVKYEPALVDLFLANLPQIRPRAA